MKDVDDRDVGQYVTTSVPGQVGLVQDTGDFISRALNHLQETRAAAGLNAGEPIEFVAAPNFQTASSGAVSVHAQQYHQGIPLFFADSTVTFGPDGSLQLSVGSTVEVGGASVSSQVIEPQAAVAAAIAFLNRPDNRESDADQFGQVADAQPVLGPPPTETIAAFPELPPRPTVLEPGPFEGRGIGCHLVWLPVKNELRLGWLMELMLPATGGAVILIVDALDSSIRYASTTSRAIAARGLVFPLNGDQARVDVPWPQPLSQYTVTSKTALPPGFPDPWVSAQQTVGNCVSAIDADTDKPVDGALTGGIVEFSVADQGTSPQRVVNLFYFCCLLHDLYYLLGFREADGNFQLDTFGRGGAPSDPALAIAYSGAVSSTANMTTPKDGSQPRLNVGVVAATGRHTALDATVVFHEFSHGLTSRLVGGPLNALSLLSPQSAGMSEGWSDYLACTIANTQVIAAWVVNKPGGIRRHPYDSNYPGTFADLGQPDYSNSHQIGELWCATLLEFDRRVGSALALQVVVDSLKLGPANPSFLDMRDAMLRALDGMQAAGAMTTSEHKTATDALWSVFAHSGMGIAASCDGSQLTGIAADFTTPATPSGASHTLTAQPATPIPDKDPRGVASKLTFDVPGVLRAITVSVNIAHEFRGDLQITVTSPAGTSVVLRQPNADSGVGLVTSYDLTNAPALSVLVGQPVRGAWTLNVADLQRLSTGVLRSWTLTVTAQ
jgi:extracellular elastinolytic metalloproteinase